MKSLLQKVDKTVKGKKKGTGKSKTLLRFFFGELGEFLPNVLHSGCKTARSIFQGPRFWSPRNLQQPFETLKM